MGRGGTGDPPVSSGHWPDETATRAATHGPEGFAHRFQSPPRFYFRVVSRVSWLIHFGNRV